MASRSNFATEFLLRELLAALGAPLAAPNASKLHADSFSASLSEETESQSAPGPAIGGQSRVMLVRRTNNSQQTVTLVDREYGIEAFIPSHVAASLKRERGYQTLGKLRGSVVRVTKYHFATLARCLATDQQSRETSVSAPRVARNKACVYLWVDALAIVEDNELAIKSLPNVYAHSLVEERLRTLSDAELEKQLMINQGLSPLRNLAESDRFDDDRPLLEEDCVIPEDQAQELEEQDEWGPPTTMERQPTESELIEENGTVPMPESQAARGPQLTQDSIASNGNLSVILSGNPSVTLSDEVSVGSSIGSQRFQSQQENARETFVVGNGVESSDTKDEDNMTQGIKDATPNTPKFQQRFRSKRENSSVNSSPAPTTPKPSEQSWAVVDLTGDTPEHSPRRVRAFEKRKAAKQDWEPKIEPDDSRDPNSDPAVSSTTASETQQASESQTPTKGWGIRRILRTLVNFVPSAEDSHTDGKASSDEEEDEAAENDQNATQILDQAVEVEEEDKKEEGAKANLAQPEELMSSQATVVLQYTVDNDEDANAFEYEGVLEDNVASPRSPVHERDGHAIGGNHSPSAEEEDWDDDLTLTEEEADTAMTPQKKLGVTEDNARFKTPPSSAQVATPGTERRADVAARQTPTISTDSVAEPGNLGHGTSQPGSPPSSEDPVLATDPSGRLSPVKSPSKLVISVDNSSSRASRTGLSSAGSRGFKRCHEQADSKDISPASTAQQENPSSAPNNQVQPRVKTQKRRRRDILSSPAPREPGSQSPQFEQPAVPTSSRQRFQSVRRIVVADCYSFDAVCRSLGSHVRGQAIDDDQRRLSRQPRRAWKQYENLFPPLNMTRLKQMMAESKDK